MLYTTCIRVFHKNLEHSIEKTFDEYINVLQKGETITVTLDIKSTKLEDYNAVTRSIPITGEIMFLSTRIERNRIKNQLEVQKSVLLKVDLDTLQFIFEEIENLKKDIEEYKKEHKKK